MSTNYYVKLDEATPCSKCGHATRVKLHIGASSVGWCFALHVIPERGLNSWEDWKGFLKSDKVIGIYDEYERKIRYADLIEVVEERSFLLGDGIHECTRHKVDGVHCIGNGEGTWDLMIGEFS